MIKPIDPFEEPESLPLGAYPTTVKEAVGILVELLAEDEDLPNRGDGPNFDAAEALHIGLGAYIRNQFGLWHGNKALLEDCGVTHADDASAVIIRALLRKLDAGREV